MKNSEDFLPIHKGIQDNICGYIGLTEAEFKLINLPIFQRLRRLTQIGLGHYVYPTMNHTRFVHSLGVLYFADQMIVALQKKNEYFKGKRKLIRFAALLHDIGHYPLSHICEIATMNFENKKKENRWDDNTVKLTKKEKELHELNLRISKLNPSNHQAISALIVSSNQEIINILKSEGIEPYDISRLIVKGYPDAALQFIINSNACADMFDFLVRDSSSVGLKFGIIQANNLIRYLDFERGHIGFYVNALRDVEHFVFGSYLSYLQLPYGKDVVAFNQMAIKFYEELLKIGVVPNYYKLLEIINTEDYNRFDDTFFFSLIDRVLLDKKFKKEVSPFCIDLATKIGNRDPIKEVLSIEFCSDSDDKTVTNKFRKELEDAYCALQIPDEWKIIFEKDYTFSKMNPLSEKNINSEETFDIIKIINRDRCIQFINYIENSLIQKICSLHIDIVRYYTKDKMSAFALRIYKTLKNSDHKMLKMDLLRLSNTAHDKNLCDIAIESLLKKKLVKQKTVKKEIYYTL